MGKAPIGMGGSVGGLPAGFGGGAGWVWPTGSSACAPPWYSGDVEFWGVLCSSPPQNTSLKTGVGGHSAPAFGGLGDLGSHGDIAASPHEGAWPPSRATPKLGATGAASMGAPSRPFSAGGGNRAWAVQADGGDAPPRSVPRCQLVTLTGRAGWGWPGLISAAQPAISLVASSQSVFVERVGAAGADSVRLSGWPAG